jgi:hypothetical protein
VGTAEATIEYQNDVNRVTKAMILSLDADLSHTERRILEMFEANNQRIAQEFAELKKDYDHRFDLQTAENLRTQQHISSLKAENNQLKRKLVSICFLSDILASKPIELCLTRRFPLVLQNSFSGTNNQKAEQTTSGI